MEKYYITADKVGEFIAAMFAKGIKAEADPKSYQIIVSKPNGGYEWIKVFRKGSFEELCNMFDEKNV